MAPRWDSQIGDWVDDETGIVGTPTGTPTPDDPGGSPGSGYYGDGGGTGTPDPATPPPPTPTPTPTPTPKPTATPLDIQPWGTWTGGPTPRPLPDLPKYTPPPAFKFNAPSVDEALNDPGFIFRRDQGDQGVQAWAAAKGTLNDTGTAHALSDYNQNAASQEYASIWNRDWQSQSGQYDTNYKTQYADPYQFALNGYNSLAPNILHQNDLDYQHAYDLFLEQDARHRFDATNALGA